MFRLFEIIDASNEARLRRRVMLRVRLGRFRFNIPMTQWFPCSPMHIGHIKRLARYHCDMCEKYLDWSD